MRIHTFNDHYLNPLLDNLSKEANKIIALQGYFNIDLLNIDTSKHVSTLWMIYCLICYNPRFFYLTVSSNSKTRIDDIFCNIPIYPLVKSAVPGNISSSILDHHPQFFILPELFSNSLPTKYNIISHDW